MPETLVSGIVVAGRQKWAVMPASMAGGMVRVAKECQNPKNEHVLLVFGVGRLVG